MLKSQKILSAVILATGILGGSGAAMFGFGDKGVEDSAKKPYLDIGGVWTDCYGNTKNVNPNRIRSAAECEALLGGEAKRIAELIEPHLPDASVKTLASFISFTYNVGDTGFLTSTVLKDWKRGEKLGACLRMFEWVFVKKIYSRGLYNRRMVEVHYCVRGLYE